MLARLALALLVTLAAPASAAFLGSHGGPSAWTTWHAPLQPPYQGPCDVIAAGCVEAHSVTRAMRAAYSGPLFQLWNGTTTLDVGQTVDHKADMTTWSAFCGGVQSNCKISIIYAQVHGSANNLLAATLNTLFGPNCTSGGPYGTGPYVCAAPFYIEPTSGLPMVKTTVPYEYSLANDNPATGISGGTAPIGVFASLQPVSVPACCSNYGLAHKYDDWPQFSGTDFATILAYGADGNTAHAQCGATTNYCAGIDFECCGLWSTSPSNVYSTTLVTNLLFTVTWSPATNFSNAWINTHALLTNVLPDGTWSYNYGTRMRIGGGGDLSQPADTRFREGGVVNVALTVTDDNALFANETAFYSGLSFPIPTLP